MPKTSTHGFERRIATECPQLSRGQVKAAAKKIMFIAQNMQETFDFFEGLRILGMVTDTTARDAIRNLEDAVAA